MSKKHKAKLEKYLYRKGVMKTSKFRVPDFIGIGAQKAGTTWLYENLKMHPEVFMPEIKELHYFDMEERFEKPLKWYFDHFANADKNKVAGEITPAYSILPGRRISLMKKLMPCLKIIFAIRNPVERAWSHAIMELVDWKNMKFEDVKESEFIDHFNSKASVLRSKYLNTLAIYYKYFKKERIFTCFIEEITDNPKDLLERIFYFLNVSGNVEWDYFPYKEKIFVSEKIKIPLHLKQYLLKMYKEDIEKIKVIFPDKNLKW